MNNRSSIHWSGFRHAGAPYIAALLLLLTGCQTKLYSDLSEKHANEMVALLIGNGIQSEKTPGAKNSYGISVESSRMSEAVTVLRAHGYPKESFESLGEMFKKEGLISSPMEERVRFLHALSQNVSETISQIDGVLTARVHVVLPENDPLAENVKPSSASVFIKYWPQANLENIKSDIKLIVEKSIEGLAYDRISVVMVAAQSDLADGVTNAFAQVFGIRVAANSSSTLRSVFAAFFGLVVVLLGVIAYLLRRLGLLSPRVLLPQRGVGQFLAGTPAS